jgi:tetratricopeptide (TPR) repeat protein
MSEIMVRNGINVSRGQKPAYPQLQTERILLDELQATAKLHPDHLLWQSQLVHQLTVAGWQAHLDKNAKPGKTFKPARPEDTQTIREALGRIESLANEGKGETSAFCHSMLAALYSFLEDHAAAEKHARKVLDFDPKHQIAAEQLQQTLSTLGKHADQLVAAQALATASPTSRNFFLLSKALVLNGRDDHAESAGLAGLKKNANDVHCLLGMTAILMRKSADEKTLKLADEMLEKARREAGPDAGASVFLEIEYLNALHQALMGETVFARLKLERLRQDYPDSQRFEKALRAFGQ